MKTLSGDLIALAKRRHFDLIVHGCNCFCTMGAGIARQIKDHFPEAYEADLATEEGDRSKLGTISWAGVEVEGGRLIVVNGYTQFHYHGAGRLVDYDAVRRVFRTVKKQFSGRRIGYPAIGAGLAGGDWELIAQIIDEELAGEDHTFVVFEPE